MHRSTPTAIIALAAASLAPVMAAHAETFTTLYRFQSEATGYVSLGGLVVAGATHPVLYGTASGGKQSCPNGCGTVFSVNTRTGAEHVFAKFRGANAYPNALAVSHEGRLFGTAFGDGEGTAFQLNPATGKITTLFAFSGQDGALPNSIVLAGGKLYGTTVFGGTPRESLGTAFSIDINTRTETVIHSFINNSVTGDGEIPYGAVYHNGTLYGSTKVGGAEGYGAIFAVDTQTGAERILYSFTGKADGSSPSHALALAGGAIYGATGGGGYGNCDCGSIFSIDPTTDAYKLRYSFPGGIDGEAPTSIVSVGEVIYGATFLGGTNGLGTIFKYDITTGVKKVLYSFTGGSDGYSPSELIYSGGVLYGVTDQDQYNKCCATIFKFVP